MKKFIGVCGDIEGITTIGVVCDTSIEAQRRVTEDIIETLAMEEEDTEEYIEADGTIPLPFTADNDLNTTWDIIEVEV